MVVVVVVVVMVVVGTLDYGMSSLLSARLGEMKKLKGQVSMTKLKGQVSMKVSLCCDCPLSLLLLLVFLLVVVVVVMPVAGTLDYGMSSLLSACLREMKKLKGQVSMKVSLCCDLSFAVAVVVGGGVVVYVVVGGGW